MKALDDGGDADSILFCKRCHYMQPDPRGDVRTWSVLISGLPAATLQEDVHAELDDHFGYVHSVQIPKGASGRPKLDGDGYCFAIAKFYWRGEGKYGQVGALNAGWCWDGSASGRRARIHRIQVKRKDRHGGKYEQLGPVALRGNESFGNPTETRGEIRSNDTALGRRYYAVVTRNQIMKRSKEKSQHLTDKIRTSTLFHQVVESKTPEEAAALAAKTDDVEKLRTLLKINDFAIECNQSHGEGFFDPYSLKCEGGGTLFHIAARRGSIGVLHYLMSFEVQGKVTVMRHHGTRASRQGDRQLIENSDAEAAPSIAYQGGDENMLAVAINQLDYQNCAPLHLAAIQGNPQSVYLLINHGADPARKSLGAMTPIHYAAATGNSEAVLALLPHLATNFATQEFNLDGLSARDLALQNSHATLVDNIDRWMREQEMKKHALK